MDFEAELSLLIDAADYEGISMDDVITELDRKAQALREEQEYED